MQQQSLELPSRPGPKPETTHPSRTHPRPHQQISQNAPPDLQEKLFTRAASLTGVSVGKSLVSVPGPGRSIWIQISHAVRPRHFNVVSNSRTFILPTMAVFTSHFRRRSIRTSWPKAGANRTQ